MQHLSFFLTKRNGTVLRLREQILFYHFKIRYERNIHKYFWKKFTKRSGKFILTVIKYTANKTDHWSSDLIQETQNQIFAWYTMRGFFSDKRTLIEQLWNISVQTLLMNWSVQTTKNTYKNLLYWISRKICCRNQILFLFVIVLFTYLLTMYSKHWKTLWTVDPNIYLSQHFQTIKETKILKHDHDARWIFKKHRSTFLHQLNWSIKVAQKRDIHRQIIVTSIDQRYWKLYSIANHGLRKKQQILKQRTKVVKQETKSITLELAWTCFFELQDKRSRTIVRKKKIDLSDIEQVAFYIKNKIEMTKQIKLFEKANRSIWNACW